MLKQGAKLILSLLLCGIIYFNFYIRGNNRFTIYHHHGLWLPSSTQNIKFEHYPDFPNISDDVASNVCEMNKYDYFKLLKKQEYSYLIKVDTSEDKKNCTIIESDYGKIPDSLIIKFPAKFKCKSSTGDFLIISAEAATKDMIKVELHTDWN